MLQVANYNEIVPHLYVGNKYALSDTYLFDLIINCTPDLQFPILEIQNKYKQEYIRISIKDDPFEANKLYNILEDEKILETINKYISQNKNVLIHCNMGQQRSCAVCACYLLKYSGNGININNVIEKIKTKRPMAFFGGINFIDTISKY